MIKKQFYEAPEAERIDVSFERCILSEPGSTDESSFGEKGNVKDKSKDVWQWM